MIIDFKHEYSYLSNFFPRRIKYNFMSFPTAEHAYQAAKTTDLDWRHRIRGEPTPGRAKKMGRHVPLRPNWEKIKVDIMREILVIKFSQPDLRAGLLATGDEVLVEGNNWNDAFWGAIWVPANHYHVDKQQWSYSGDQRLVGYNTLGRLLMEVRESCRTRS